MAACDRLHTLTVAWEHGPESISLEGGRDDVVLRVPVNVMLARSPAGWVLLETGLRRAAFPDVYTAGEPEFATGGDPLLDALAACGVAREDLVAVAVSHLHLDHTGGLRHAPIPVTAQRREVEYARTRATRAQAYVREDYEDVPWRLIDGDAQIAPGIDAVFTPGHTPGHMSYRVRMGKSGTWLFAVDAIDLQAGVEEDRPVGSSADPVDAPRRRASHERLVALAAAEGARLVPGHDPATWAALSGRTWR